MSFSVSCEQQRPRVQRHLAQPALRAAAEPPAAVVSPHGARHPALQSPRPGRERAHERRERRRVPRRPRVRPRVRRALLRAHGGGDLVVPAARLPGLPGALRDGVPRQPRAPAGPRAPASGASSATAVRAMSRRSAAARAPRRGWPRRSSMCIARTAAWWSRRGRHGRPSTRPCSRAIAIRRSALVSDADETERDLLRGVSLSDERGRAAHRCARAAGDAARLGRLELPHPGDRGRGRVGHLRHEPPAGARRPASRSASR